MRYRIGTAPTARVLPTLDGPLAVKAGEVVVVAVLQAGDMERVCEVMRELERGRK